MRRGTIQVLQNKFRCTARMKPTKPSIRISIFVKLATENWNDCHRCWFSRMLSLAREGLIWIYATFVRAHSKFQTCFVINSEDYSGGNNMSDCLDTDWFLGDSVWWLCLLNQSSLRTPIPGPSTTTQALWTTSPITPPTVTTSVVSLTAPPIVGMTYPPCFAVASMAWISFPVVVRAAW